MEPGIEWQSGGLFRQIDSERPDGAATAAVLKDPATRKWAGSLSAHVHVPIVATAGSKIMKASSDYCTVAEENTRTRPIFAFVENDRA